MFRRLATATVLTAALTVLAPALQAAETVAALIMVERPGCAYCIQWKKDVGATEYAATAEGAFAPLTIIDMRDAPPAGITFARPVVFTPTFVLIANGTEVDRIEGYPGEDFFWGLLAMKLKAKTAFPADS